MIGSGLKKYAAENGMKVASGVAYGSLKGFATTLFEGSGWKQLVVTTRFPEPAQEDEFRRVVGQKNVAGEFRVQNINHTPLGIGVVFADNPGTMKKIRAFVDWFYPLLAQYGAEGVGVCGHCHAAVDAGCWVLLDGVAFYVHESCARQMEESVAEENTQRKQEDTGSYGAGLVGAVLGAALGAVVWALVLLAGYVASLVGLLIGWLADKGYRLLKGRQGKGKVAILILAVILGVCLGTFLADGFTLVQMINDGELPGFAYGDIPGMILTILINDSEYASATLGNIAMGLLFAGLGVFALLRKANKEVADAKIKRLP